MTKNKISLATNFLYDFRAGIVSFLVALPLCLGIALASGAPLFSGIVSGVIGGIVIGALSGSSISVSGPAAGLIVIVLSSVERLGRYEVFLLAISIAGIIQILLGLLKCGGISHYFPSAVIKGMLAAIGITLIFKQIPHALGYDANPTGEFAFDQPDKENTFSELWQAAMHIHPGAVVISVISLAILLAWELPAIKKMSFFKLVPAALVVVMLGIGLNYGFESFSPYLLLSSDHLVNLPRLGKDATLADLIVLPDFSQYANGSVYLAALTIAVVASLETLLNLKAADKIDPLKRQSPPNRELMAQGVGNLLSGLVGGLPITTVIVRTTANVIGGARSRIATITHGALLLGCVMLIPGLLNRIPLSALAAILLFLGYKLTHLSIFREYYRLGLHQFLPFIVTIFAILFTDLLIGIGIGMVVGFFYILRANYKTAYFFHKSFDPEKEFIHIDLSEHVSFLNKASIIEILDHLPENSTVEIDGRNSLYIDHDVLEVIDDFQQTAHVKNIRITLLLPPGKDVQEVPGQPIKDTATPPVKKEEPMPRATDAIHISYRQLFENNRNWVARKLDTDPRYFENMALGQQPKFLFIGCSDSRVQLATITGTVPGETFVHHNVANLVLSTDMNLLAVLQYAVEVLKVEHIIVCGHYGCGGVKAAMSDQSMGMINTWLSNIKDVYRLHQQELDAIPTEAEKFKRLVELNVIEQVNNLYKTSVVQKAWHNADIALRLHGWVYDIREGLLKDMEVDIKKTFTAYDKIYRFQEDDMTGEQS